MTDIRASVACLLDREVTEEFLRESTAQVAARKSIVELGTKSVVLFRIGAEWFALPTGVLQEIADRSTVRTLPGHQGGILSGLVNVRGELLLCLALGVVLGVDKSGEKLESGKPASSERLMICKRGDARLVFQVSEVYGLHRYHPRELKNAPATLARSAEGIYTFGVVRWKDKIVGCLDDELLFYTLNKSLT